MFVIIIISVALLSAAVLSLKYEDKVCYLSNEFSQERWLHHKEVLHKTFTEGNWVNLPTRRLLYMYRTLVVLCIKHCGGM